MSGSTNNATPGSDPGQAGPRKLFNVSKLPGFSHRTYGGTLARRSSSGVSTLRNAASPIHYLSPPPSNPIPPSTAVKQVPVTMAHDDKLIEALVLRILCKVCACASKVDYSRIHIYLAQLPHRSHRRLPSLSADDTVRQSCNTLWQFCRTRMPFIVQLFLNELDLILRVSFPCWSATRCKPDVEPPSPPPPWSSIPHQLKIKPYWIRSGHRC